MTFVLRATFATAQWSHAHATGTSVVRGEQDERPFVEFDRRRLSGREVDHRVRSIGGSGGSDVIKAEDILAGDQRLIGVRATNFSGGSGAPAGSACHRSSCDPCCSNRGHQE